MNFVEPVTLIARGVTLEPLALNHEAGLRAAAAEPMPPAMIDKLLASRTRNSIGKIKAHRQTLSFEQLRIYFEEKRKPLGRQFKTNLELITENGALNYAAYLLADENGMSIKVAKYRGKDRVHLVESNEYGYCSLIKATKAVLDKLDLENKTASTITAKERITFAASRPVQEEAIEQVEATKQNISLHLKNIFEDGELNADSVVKESLTVQTLTGVGRGKI